MPYVPRLPHKVKVDVTKYHACHVKGRWISQSATPATPTAAVPFPATPAQAHHRSQPNAIRATPATQMCDDKLCVSKLCVNKVCVSKLCDDKMCDDKLCVSKLFDDKLCGGTLCEDKLCDDKSAT